MLTGPDNDYDELMNETIGFAVIDSGCTKTVCGNVWLRTYLDTLSNRDHRAVTTEDSKCDFRFGDGPVYSSSKIVTIPVTFGSQKARLATHVVECDVPLLISRQSLKRAHCQIDFVQDRVYMFGEEVMVKLSKTGHYCLPLTSDNREEIVQNVLFSSPINPGSETENLKKVTKLHKQFAHPSSERLKRLIWNSGVRDPGIDKVVDDVTQKCDICKRFRRSPPRPIVTFPLASEFNETVAMDIKFINTRPVLHMIDHATRFSRACLLPNKKPNSVIQAIMTHWIQIFGHPVQFLTDNGGEFVNSSMIELSEKFNIVLKTTAAESAWSNGLCERHNGIIADMVAKIQGDTNCSLELAIPWATSAKNSLSNVYGFSPNQLVFGRNIRLPNVQTDNPPAQNNFSCNELIANHLLALHKARQTFIAQESCEKLRRALNKQTRTFSDHVYHNGDGVYYKRQNNVEWHGPAKVLGRDGSQYLLKHGGTYVRVHPCKMQPVNSYVHTDNDDVPLKQKPDLEDKTFKYPEDKLSNQPSETHSVGNILSPHLSPTVTSELHDASEESHSQSNQELRVNKVPRAVSRLANFNVSPKRSSNSTTPIDAQSIPSSQTRNFSKEDAEMGIIKVEKPRNLPKPSTKIRYQKENCDEWTLAEVISRAGKSTCPNWHYMNIIPQDENDAVCISFKGSKWEEIPSDNNSDQEEVYFGTSTDSHRFDSAKLEEIQKWRDFGTFTEVDDIGQPRISTRWVCTEKVKGGNLILKARLVARGFEEDQSQLRTDSPTCSKESLRMLLCVLSAKKWSLQTIDIKSAYLQGNFISREICLQPPSCANTDKLWKLIKTPYGLVDAGRQWYIRIVKEFTKWGAKQSKSDRAVFIWKDPDGCGPCGILIAHVDDFLFGGNDHFLNTVLPKIRSTFEIGLEEHENLKYLGLNIHQTSQNISLSLDMYTNNLEEINTTHYVGVDKKKPLTPDELKRLKQTVGQINWVTTQSRPDIAFDNCMLGNSISHASVSNIYQANKVLKKIRGQSVTLNFPSSLNLNTCHIVCFSDASFANLPDRGSQGGYIIFLVDSNGEYVILAWQSKRIKRVVNSSLSAECLQAVEAAETCILLRDRFEDFLCLPSKSVKISIIIDNKSLLDAVHTSTSVENKRLQIDINMLREMIENGEINEFRWISTAYQVANPLTKNGASTDYLLRIIWCALRYEHSTSTFH